MSVLHPTIYHFQPTFILHANSFILNAFWKFNSQRNVQTNHLLTISYYCRRRSNVHFELLSRKRIVMIIPIKICCKLTLFSHSHFQTFLQSAMLTLIPMMLIYRTISISSTLIWKISTHGSLKETLATCKQLYIENMYIEIFHTA